MANKKHLTPEQYENIIEHMRSRLRRQEQRLSGLDELVKSMDAILYEIAQKYGEPYIDLAEETAARRGGCTDWRSWMLKIPKPDVSKMLPKQVISFSDGDCYVIKALCRDKCEAINAYLDHCKKQTEEINAYLDHRKKQTEEIKDEHG